MLSLIRFYLFITFLKYFLTFVHQSALECRLKISIVSNYILFSSESAVCTPSHLRSLEEQDLLVFK